MLELPEIRLTGNLSDKQQNTNETGAPPAGSLASKETGNLLGSTTAVVTENAEAIVVTGGAQEAGIATALTDGVLRELLQNEPQLTPQQLSAKLLSLIGEKSLAHLETFLAKAGMSINTETLQILQSLMNEQVQLTVPLLKAISRALQAQGTTDRETVRAAAFLAVREMPISPENLKLAKLFLGEHGLGKALGQILAQHSKNNVLASFDKQSENQRLSAPLNQLIDLQAVEINSKQNPVTSPVMKTQLVSEPKAQPQLVQAEPTISNQQQDLNEAAAVQGETPRSTSAPKQTTAHLFSQLTVLLEEIAGDQEKLQTFLAVIKNIASSRSEHKSLTEVPGQQVSKPQAINQQQNLTTQFLAEFSEAAPAPQSVLVQPDSSTTDLHRHLQTIREGWQGQAWFRQLDQQHKTSLLQILTELTAQVTDLGDNQPDLRKMLTSQIQQLTELKPALPKDDLTRLINQVVEQLTAKVGNQTEAGHNRQNFLNDVLKTLLQLEPEKNLAGQLTTRLTALTEQLQTVSETWQNKQLLNLLTSDHPAAANLRELIAARDLVQTAYQNKDADFLGYYPLAVQQGNQQHNAELFIWQHKQQKQAQGDQQGLHILFLLNTAITGPWRIDLHNRGENISLNLTVNREDIGRKVQSQLNLLEQRITALGFKVNYLNCQVHKGTEKLQLEQTPNPLPKAAANTVDVTI